MKLLLAVITIFIFTFTAYCQETTVPESGSKGGSYEKTFSTVRIGLAQSVMTVPEGELHFVVQHRFSELTTNVNDFFGLDFAFTRIGFDYGISKWLSTGIGRSMSLKTYDFALKAVILKQNKSNIPVSLSWYGSAMENTSQYHDNAGNLISVSFGQRLSFANQLIIARNQGIFSFQVSPMWLHINSDLPPSDTINVPHDIFAIDLGTRIRLGERFALIGEYIPILTNAPYPRTNPFTIGLDITVGGHQFELILSNSQATDENSMLTNPFGTWSDGHIYFGFNLTRVFLSKNN